MGVKHKIGPALTVNELKELGNTLGFRVYVHDDKKFVLKEPSPLMEVWYQWTGGAWEEIAEVGVPKEVIERAKKEGRL